MEVQPGYWDYERCSWVGCEPTYLLPSGRAVGAVHGLAVPAQSRTSEPQPADARPEVTAITPA